MGQTELEFLAIAAGAIIGGIVIVAMYAWGWLL